MAIGSSTISVAAVLDAVEGTLGAAPSLRASCSYDELREGFESIDCPLLMIHPAGGDCRPPGATQQQTFGGGVQLTVLEVIADLYARERSIMKEDMQVTVEMIDELITILQDQRRPPFFGITPANAIKAYTWNWRRITFITAGKKYMGARFRIWLRLF